MKRSYILARIIRHIFSFKAYVARCFPNDQLIRIESQVSLSETGHMAEILCIIESSWDLRSLWQGKSVKQRALQWFGQTRLWDTQYNTGVLLYVSFADKRIEIVADRGIAQVVSDEHWQVICDKMSQLFAQKRYIEAVEFSIKAVDQRLQEFVPRDIGQWPYVNQVPNQVLLV